MQDHIQGDRVTWRMGLLFIKRSYSSQLDIPVVTVLSKHRSLWVPWKCLQLKFSCSWHPWTPVLPRNVMLQPISSWIHCQSIDSSSRIVLHVDDQLSLLLLSQTLIYASLLSEVHQLDSTVQDTMKLLMPIGKAIVDINFFIPLVEASHCSLRSYDWSLKLALPYQLSWRCQTKLSLWQQWTSTEGKVPCVLQGYEGQNNCSS